MQLLLSLSRFAVIEEQNVRLKLTITDTPGFGDQINNDKWSVNVDLFCLHVSAHIMQYSTTHTADVLYIVRTYLFV